jgi:hypothetical protein
LRSARGAGVLVSLPPVSVDDDVPPVPVLDPLELLLLPVLTLLEVPELPMELLELPLLLDEGLPDVLPLIDEPEPDIPFDPEVVPFDDEPCPEALEVPPVEPALPEVCA